MIDSTRRSFSKAAVATLLAPAWLDAFAQAPAAQRGTQVVLLGTKGGPTPSPQRSQPANLLLVDGKPYVIDCGNGVATQLVKAGVRLNALDDVFVTHLHSDHVADLGTLLLLAWGSGLKTPVHLFGPPRLGKMIDDFVDMQKVDLDIRESEEGRPHLASLIQVKEIDAGGVVMEDDRVRVTAALVDHYTLKPAFAYRFDTRSSQGPRSVVFSGDTTYSENLIRLAKDADVLVHEVMYLPALEKLMAADNNAPTLLDHLMKAHTTTEQLGKVAAAARVKTLVLSHLVPGADPAITDAMWTEGVRKYYDGRIIVGQDLMTI